jgi:DNA helicase HerA-like ATPase
VYVTSIASRIAARFWNFAVTSRRKAGAGDLSLGRRVKEGALSRQQIGLPVSQRVRHISILGKTGTGKTSLIKYLLRQDISLGNGFCVIDLHGDLTPFVLSAIAERENRTKSDLSARLILVDPSSPDYSYGKKNRPV